jgi:hypothetical protein
VKKAVFVFSTAITRESEGSSAMTDPDLIPRRITCGSLPGRVLVREAVRVAWSMVIVDRIRRVSWPASLDGPMSRSTPTSEELKALNEMNLISTSSEERAPESAPASVALLLYDRREGHLFNLYSPMLKRKEIPSG